jgi:hypothetical protein
MRQQIDGLLSNGLGAQESPLNALLRRDLGLPLHAGQESHIHRRDPARSILQEIPDLTG